MRTWALTIAAMLAFASNSLLCRLAMGHAQMDPVSFTAIRLTSGAAFLALLLTIREPKLRPWRARLPGSWTGALTLCAYAIPFSFAFVSLTAGMGALLLFGSVQATMILAGLWRGERPPLQEWIGLGVALAGLVYLVFPGLDAADPLHAGAMVLAGTAWGIYSLRGRQSTSPVAETTGNFVRAVPIVSALAVVFIPTFSLPRTGMLAALASGIVTSGLGYVIWYAALAHHTRTRAAIVQLSVPVLAGLAGVVLLSEPLALRLGISTILVLGGVVLAIVARRA